MRSRFVLSLAVVIFASVPLLRAQTPQEIRSAFTNIRSDDKPMNAIEATEWLYKHRERLKGDLLTELYKTDRQGRDAILLVLFKTKSFQPDERFARFVMARFPEQDSRIGNIALGQIGYEGGDQDYSRGGAHWESWKFIDSHYELFEPFLVEWVGKTNDMLSLWATSWLMKKRGVFESHADLFTPPVLTRIAGHLDDDKVEFNAGQAIRVFLLLGDRGLPVLRQVAQSKDAQARSFALALIDALAKGSHKAFAFLSTKSNLTLTPFGKGPGDPEWVGPAVEALKDREKYP